MDTYHTFIIVDCETSFALMQLHYPSEWKLLSIDDPSSRYWQYKDGSGYVELAGNSPHHVTETMVQMKEVLLVANNKATADNIFSLLHSASLLVYPDIYKINSTGWLLLTDHYKIPDFKTEFFFKSFTRNEYLYPGVLFLLNSWRDNTLLYAIEKYQVSIELDSFTPHSANPVYGQKFDNFDPSYRYHVVASYAVNCAFSIIEEIGLEIRTSSKKQRFIKNGLISSWNPVVYQETDDRLKGVGLAASFNFQWIERGDETDVQKDIKPKFGVPVFSDNTVIRDVNIELIEAIHRCSYIRNFISAHKFSELTQFISPYDVYNVQTVSRLLLIHKIGLWSTLLKWRQDIKILYNKRI
jgi:hypothetical protein